MKQTKINLQKTRESVDEANRRCAEIILASMEDGNVSGLMMEWAKAILARAEEKGPQIGERCE